MKKLMAYILGFVACAWLINWGFLVLIIAVVFIGWFAFRIIKSKDWR